MAISVKHKFTSAKADSADASIVRPSNWNEDHNINLNGFSLVGKATAGAGAATEITLANGLLFSSGQLQTNNAAFDTATLNAAFATRVQKTGDTMSGNLNMQASNASPPIYFTAVGVRQWFLQANSDAFFRIVDQSANAEAFRVGPDGSIWCRQLGDINNRIEQRAGDYADDRASRCVQQSQAAGYVEVSIKTGSGGGGDINNAGYYVCRIYKSGVEQINVATRQLQLYAPSRGWFAAFPF